jgi:hypothetical protein
MLAGSPEFQFEEQVLVFDASMPPRRRRSGLWAVVIGAAVVAALVVTYVVTRPPAKASAHSGSDPSAGSGNMVSGPATASGVPDGVPADGAVLDKAAAAALSVSLEGPAAQNATITLDGTTVQPTAAGAALTWKPATPLPDGVHDLVVAGPGVPGGRIERKFSVDSTPPALTVVPPKPLPSGTTALTVTGRTDPGATVTADGQSATVSADGSFALTLATAPSAVVVQARDAAGNVTTDDVTVVSVLPGTRAVHLTALAFSYAPLRDPVLALARNKQINAVELDIKDEDGYIGYDSQVPLARQDGASKRYYDAKKAIAQLHALGVRVIGRLVCFRDPTLAKWAWNHGHKDAVIQTPAGAPYTGPYGAGGYAFTNFANKLVRDYNNDIAVEAAKLGFDDILFDYVRRPDGKLATMKIVGMSKNPSADVAEFVHETRVALAAAGTHTFLGASVFGIAATRPKEIAQDVPMLAKYVDYVAPMVYPSHWAPGEYNVKNPSASPYQIVQRSLKDFQKDLKGTHAQVVPWLQDFYHYSAAQVDAQIKAAHDDGIDSFLLWNAGASYTGAALPKAR